jgi:hypothetical protein
VRAVLRKLAQQRGDGRLLLAPCLQGIDALEKESVGEPHLLGEPQTLPFLVAGSCIVRKTELIATIETSASAIS